MSVRVKKLALDLGADLCGIAPTQRFAAAPAGFRPTDTYEACKSVLVFAKKLPHGSLSARNCIPYTFVNTMITQEVDRLTLEISTMLEHMGVANVPLPSDDPYEHWEAERSYGRATLSLRHAGYLAGLGALGKNTLLINERFGSMIQIGAILLDARLEGDPLAPYQVCPPGCSLCIDACPVGALDGDAVNQQLCRPLSHFKNEKGYILKKCYQCRSVCPNSSGIGR